MTCLIEQRHAVTHVLECDAEFPLTLADLIQQPRILHRNDRLRRKILQQRDLLVGEWPHFLAKYRNSAEQLSILTESDRNIAACTPEICERPPRRHAGPVSIGICYIY